MAMDTRTLEVLQALIQNAVILRAIREQADRDEVGPGLDGKDEILGTLDEIDGDSAAIRGRLTG